MAGVTLSLKERLAMNDLPTDHGQEEFLLRAYSLGKELKEAVPPTEEIISQLRKALKELPVTSPINMSGQTHQNALLQATANLMHSGARPRTPIDEKPFKMVLEEKGGPEFLKAHIYPAVDRDLKRMTWKLGLEDLLAAKLAEAVTPAQVKSALAPIMKVSPLLDDSERFEVVNGALKKFAAAHGFDSVQTVLEKAGVEGHHIHDKENLVSFTGAKRIMNQRAPLSKASPSWQLPDPKAALPYGSLEHSQAKTLEQRLGLGKNQNQGKSGGRG